MSLSYKNYTTLLLTTLTHEKIQEHYGSKHNNSADSILLLIPAFLTPSGYFNNFPVTSFDKNDINSPILDCTYFDWGYAANSNKTYCLAYIQPIFDPNFYKCYTFKINDTDRQQFRAFSAIIYVDDFLENLLANYSLDILDPQAIGMRVMIHPPGTVPNMKLAMNIGPGMDTTITLTQTAQVHLPDPYSTCTTLQTLGPVNQSATYTQDYCYDVCFQKQFLQHCGCLSINYQFTDNQIKASNNTFCGSLGISDSANWNNWEAVDELNCFVNIQLDSKVCDDECLIPCQQFKYSTSISTSPWPHISSQLSVYATYIYGQSRFGHTYDEYQMLSQLAYTNASASSSLLEKLNNEGLIQDNFLQLTVRFDSQRYNEQKDVAAVPLDALGAQIGGVLSLWLGVTVILIFELCELLYNLICLYSKAKNNSTASTA